MNDNRVLKLTGIENDKLASVAEHNDTSFPIHTHSFFELELVLCGEGVQILRDGAREMKRGTVTLMTPSDYHSVEMSRDVRLLNISVLEHIIPEDVKARFFSLASYCGKLSEEDIERFCDAAKMLSHDIDDAERIGLVLRYLFSLLPKSAQKEELGAIERAALYADAHFREKLTVEDGALVACLSPVYFGELFKETMGKSFRTYINDKRLAFAKALLEEGASVANACFECGFGSLSNFAKAYKAKYNLPPRATIRNNV